MIDFKKINDWLVALVATFGGVGHLPWAPGTWASVAALILAWFFFPGLWIWTFFFCLAGFWACAGARRRYRSEDPGVFVMDEVCGMWIALLWLPKSAGLFLAAFLLFRFLDIVKPWPISRLQKMRHSSSILWDDLAAGFAANLIIRTFLFFFI